MPRSMQPTILFAGGGTGGHIFPNLAVRERLAHASPRCDAHFLVSVRPLDAQVLHKENQPFTVLPVQPLTNKPWRWPAFYLAWRASVRRVRALIRSRRVAAVVGTGGFVSGPAIVAARREGVPSALVNLDAVPGVANRRLAGWVDKVFTAYPVAEWGGAELIGLPLRGGAIGQGDPERSRLELGLDPHRWTVLVCGGSQGAQSINLAMAALLRDDRVGRVLAERWQVLHLTGERDMLNLQSAYAAAGVPAVVLPFCDRMGLAWSAADLAISRSGASSVAEAWASATPTIFLPYPFHKDEHQRHNAQPMCDAQGALLLRDAVDPLANAQQLAEPVLELTANHDAREQMAQALRSTRPGDGAAGVAQWLAGLPA